MNGEGYIPLDGESGRRDRGPRDRRQQSNYKASWNSAGYSSGDNSEPEPTNNHRQESRREREDRRDRDRERGGDRGDRRDREKDGNRERGGDRDRDRGERGVDRRRRSRSAGRRRSRSPHRRREETDTYSSSRDHQAREREDRYRGGRDDDNWRRDRGEPRRDRRDDDRPPRRDLLDDRGGRDGGRGGGRGRDNNQERKRSASPPRKPKEPTPDLTNVVSVLDRKRRLTQWDIKPPGYENVTAEQAKLSGMFPLPGAPRQQAMDPSRLQAFMNQPASSAAAASLKPSNARQSKRLFVYNIPPNTTEDQLADFLNLQVNSYNVISSADPVVSAKMSKDRSYALIELKNGEDATVCLGLDGISMTESQQNGASNGSAAQGLVLRRPKDYIAPAAAPTVDEEGNALMSTFETVLDSPSKLVITHLSRQMDGEQVQQVLSAFGTLKHFVAVQDRHTGAFEGMAFAEFEEDAATHAALEGLVGMEIGGEYIQVKYAAIGIKQASDMAASANAMSLLASTESDSVDLGRVLQLLNMVTPEELMDNEEYEEILDDVREECGKFGQVLDLKIPRSSGARSNPGVGKIFVKFDNAESAQKALKALAGRKFNDRTVVVTNFGEEYFDVEAW